MQIAGAPRNYKRCEVRSGTPEREKRASRDTGRSTPHAIPPLEKLPIALAIDPVRFIWLRVRGGHFIQEIPFPGGPPDP